MADVSPVVSQGKLDEALSTLRDGLVRDPNNKNLLDDKAEVENALKALAQAKDAVSKVLTSRGGVEGPFLSRLFFLTCLLVG